MKKVIIPLFTLLIVGISVNAQQKMEHKKHQMRQQRSMMAEQLNLSEAQKSQFKSVNEDYRKKMQELNKQENITVKEMRDKKAALHKEKKAKTENLLTPEQKSKMQQMKADRHVKKEARQAQQMEKMKEKIQLSDEQAGKLKAQREATRAEAEKIKANESLSREQKKEQMMDLKKKAKEQHDKLFTEEQLKKKEEMKKQRKPRSAWHDKTAVKK